MARKGGGDSFLAKIAFSVILVCLTFGFFNIPVPKDTKGFVNLLESRSNSLNEWVQEFTAGGFNIDRFLKGIDVEGKLGDTSDKIIEALQNEGSTSGGGNKVSEAIDSKAALAGLKNLKIANEEKVDYNRKDWNHWVNVKPSSCWNVREEVLYRDSVKGSVTLLDKNNKPTKNKSQACSIQGGKWIDFYTGKTFTNAKDLDIDHMIPLSYTAKHGGNGWSAQKKEEYANNLKNPLHLVAVSATANRQKGDKGPASWKPSDKSAQCAYGGAWVSVAGSYGISVSAADSKVIASMLASCKK